MRRKLPILSPLILLALVGAAGAGIIDPIEERIQRVFPFEVGQEYQFKAGGDFTRRDDVVLPAGTVAEITITDTVINGHTWLRIPYWNHFGTELYRLDDTRVLEWHAFGNRQEVLFDVASDEWADEPLVTFCNATDYRYPGVPMVGCDLVRHKYSIAMRAWIERNAFGVSDRVLHMRVRGQTLPGLGRDWGVGAYHGWSAPGACLHTAGHDSIYLAEDGISIKSVDYERNAIWGLFRPKSEEPWPEFDNVRTTGARLRDDTPSEGRPARISLFAYPNPFNPSIVIRYSVPDWGHASVVVYDVLGRRVRELRSGPHDPGAHMILWDGRDAHGTRAASGTYMVRVETERESVVKRVTLVR